MKLHVKLFLFSLFSGFVVLLSCNKESASDMKYDDSEFLKSIADEGADLLIRGGGPFERIITNPLVKPGDCRFITAGTIEFRKDGETVAVIDFGNGECDDMATITMRGKTTRFSLKRIHRDRWFYKVVVEPVVKTETCDYIVSGVVEFYSLKDDSWLATIDFGDGTCDEWATKTWEGGSKEFSMKDWKGKN